LCYVTFLGLGTTGLAYFAECHRHSAKAEKHSATSLPSVALGEAHTAFFLPAKPALPSAFSRALGKPLPCAKPHSAKKIETGWTIRQIGERNGRTGRTGRPNGTGSKTLPSARRVALGKDSNFAECQAGSTRQSFELCRVLPNFAECLSKCTRRTIFQ